MKKLSTTENHLLVLLACAEAALLLDRLAVGFLAPFLIPDLKLSNLQLGLLSSLFSLSFAVSGYLVSSLADRFGRRWTWITALILLFSAASAACGTSNSFTSLAAARIVLGTLEGPFLPIALAVMRERSSPARRSFNLAFVQNVGAFLLAQLAGPIILIGLAVHHGWRAAFLFTAVPGVGIAAVMFMMRRNVAQGVRPLAQTGVATTTAEAAWDRNVWVCVGIAACMGSWILLQMTFLPKYLVQAGLTPTHMSLVMSLLGVGGCAASITLPPLSDRLGRRYALRIGIALGLIGPLVALTVHAPLVLSVGILVGSIGLGCAPLYTSIIPADSSGHASTARAMAMVAGSSAIFGGVIAPSIGGILADRFGLSAILVLADVLAGLGLLLTLWLRRPIVTDTVEAAVTLQATTS
ncbi:MFS transporter [Phenylobacterium montanum]|uniref:MFS transporter n=1 Tax=Phenylobacterium montanum TaxID=2823693 RepID=A0A975G465_9CAUL|nr:MFS transporter [Caulobacter sp. S6]QUD90234.1 MFS transporter [Caulobacter sp. S6]